jgi:hypothetical protein
MTSISQRLGSYKYKTGLQEERDHKNITTVFVISLMGFV